MNVSNIKRLTATGDVTAVTSYLRGVVLTADDVAGVLVIKAGGSGGTTILTLKAAIDTSAPFTCDPVLCAGGIHATLTGAGAEASFIYE